jgi:hypothetical protein
MRDVEIDTAGTARQRCAHSTCHANADILGMQNAVGRLAQRLGDGQLVHLFIVALLKVDDLALRRARNQDHRPAVGGGVAQRNKPIQKAWR